MPQEITIDCLKTKTNKFLFTLNWTRLQFSDLNNNFLYFEISFVFKRGIFNSKSLLKKGYCQSFLTY